MTYLGYVAAAYAVFAIVMLWDMLAPAQRMRRAAAKTAPTSTDLHR
jgi:hypothetical protein